MIKVGRDNLFKVNTHFSKIAEIHFVFVSPFCLILMMQLRQGELKLISIDTKD